MDDIRDDLLDQMENYPESTVNIHNLKTAGALFKYEGKMPDIDHYNDIELEARGRDKHFMAALSKKMRKRGTFLKNINKIDIYIEKKMMKGLDNS